MEKEDISMSASVALAQILKAFVPVNNQNETMSIDDIILSQEDEPSQNNCIFCL